MRLLELDEALCPRVGEPRTIVRSFDFAAHRVEERLGRMDSPDGALLGLEAGIDLEIEHPARVGEILRDPDGGEWMRGRIRSVRSCATDATRIE